MTDDHAADPRPVLLEARSLSKSFGSFVAVDGISLRLQAGDVLGFLGPNGAGKTTTMKMLTGFLRPSGGSVVLCGHDVNSASAAAQMRLGYLPEGAPLYPDMTVAAFLEFIAEARGLARADRPGAVERAVDALSLRPVLGQTIDTLSKGYQRRVGIAQAILHDPAVLILDEPTDGLDPNQKHEVRQLIGRMATDKAIIISTHILEEVEAVCTRAMVIDHGKPVFDGTPSQLKSRSRYHGAVVLVVESDHASTAVETLQALPGAGAVERHGESAGSVAVERLTVLPSSDGEADLLASVRQALAAAGIAVRELSLETGRLDDVFRTLTRGDRRAPDAVQSGEAA